MHLTRQERRRYKHSDEFNLIFKFFLQSYRYKILDFSGIDIKTIQSLKHDDSKVCFKKFDNGEYSKNEIYSQGILTRHPNILKAIIISKKSWGLHVKMWSEGIYEGCFTKKEILEQFYSKNIIIPESFLLDLNNQIIKKFKNNGIRK